jgi:hypothetical protein
VLVGVSTDGCEPWIRLVMRLVIGMARDRDRVRALNVRSGDRVSVRGEQREVKAVRSDRRASDGPGVVMVFKSGAPLRVRATDRVAVERDGRRGRRGSR